MTVFSIVLLTMWLGIKIVNKYSYVLSRHTVVCHATQEASTPLHEYSYWQEEQKHNFHVYVLHTAFMKPDDFCCRDAFYYQYRTFQIVTKSRQAFPNYKLQKLAKLLCFFSSFCQGVKVAIRWKHVIWLPRILVHR